MKNWLCCFGVQGHDDSRHSSSLRGIQASKDSPISMSVPGASVPHALDSPDALQRIFASNSSTRGYRAVQATPPKHPTVHGSLDMGFRFGSKSPARKPHGRLEQLTQHVKQKLSEDRLSWDEQQARRSAAAPVQLAARWKGSEIDTDKCLLGESQKSLGLTDLLASRAPSEGGYDSDAKSMRTPVILSATRASQVGLKNIRHSLDPITGSQIDEQPTQLDQDLTDVINNPSTKVCMPKSSSLARKPSRNSFYEALQDSCDQRPDSVLRGPSNNVVIDTVGTPTTPEPKALHIPITGSAETEQCLALPEPPQVSSPSKSVLRADREQTQVTVSNTSRDLAHRVCIAKQGTTVSRCSHGLRSEVNPAPVGLMEHVATLQGTDEPAETSPPMTAIKNGSKQVHIKDSTSKPAVNHGDGPDETATPQESSAVSPDLRSVHLFDMSIPQKLASNSRIHTSLSKSPSNSTSTKSLAITGQTTRPGQARACSAGRAPTFIAVEHIRRPSDPETKKLFEPSELNSLYLNRSRALSCGSNAYQDHVEKRNTEDIVDDSSSFYGSIADGKIGEKEAPLFMIRKASLKNPNSFAVGGRSASGTAPEAHRMIGVERKADRRLDVQPNFRILEKAQRPETRPEVFQEAAKSRNIGTSKESKFIKIDTTPTPISRRLRLSTDANERMSEIDLEKNEDHRNRLGDSTGIQANEDRRNESLSDVDITVPRFTNMLQSNQNQTEDGWLSQGRRSGWGFHFADKTPVKHPGYDIDKENDQSILQDRSLNASVIWHKAFQRLGEPYDRGKLLATPQFDREGRRKLSVKSVSDQSRPIRSPNLSSVAHRRSRSVDTDHRESFRNEAVIKNRRKSLPILSQLGSEPMPQKSRTLTKRERLKKTSLVDLGRRAVSTITSIDANKPVASRDPFGIWGRFASHSWTQRNGPAGSSEEVRVRDFGESSHRDTSADVESPPSPDLRTRTSWSFLSLAKRKSMKDIPLDVSSADRIKQRKKAFRGRFMRLYRTKSSELHAYATTQGHRSSVSTGQTAEYPELESISGDGSFERSSPFAPTPKHCVNGGSEDKRVALLDTISEVTSKRSRSMHSHTIPWGKRDAEEWSKLYRDCVGSLSALRGNNSTEENVGNTSPAEARRVFSLTSVLRDSTVNFEAELRRDADEAKDKLLRQLQSSDEGGKVLRMPGSFV